MARKKTAVLLTFVLWSISLFAQDIKNISLKNEKILYPLRNYYIAKVKDDRADTSDIGSLRTGFLNKKNQLLNLENGAKNALTQFIHNNVQQDTSASPMELHISQLVVKEKSSSGLKTENELTIGLAFYNDAGKLVENTGGGTTQSTGDASKLIEELIRGNIDTMLHQFDEWWSKNKSFYAAQKTKPSITVEVSFEQELDDPDIISYSPKRPLTLDDFRGKPDDLSNAAAITYSIVYLKYSSARNMSNEIIVDVYVLATFNCTKSWCRKESRNEETLEHEQRHFDITAIKACELVDTIRKFQFSVDNFPRELQKIQRQKQKELDQMQDLYDSETKHGTSPLIQEKWNKRMKERLQNTTCFNS